MSVRAVALFMLLILLICVACSACSALPIPMQPVNQQYNSNYAEGAFIVLASVDTAQTMHQCDHGSDPFAVLYGPRYPKPARVLLTNIALVTVHTMITSWLDDEVAEHGNGPWYVGRVVWHGASLLAAGSAVANNRARGCAL